MPKHGRIGDTIAFLRTLNIVPANADHLRFPVADWLEEIVISPAIDAGMSQGTSGTETTRKYRRAMILILCALNGIAIPLAKQAVAQYSDLQLSQALGNMLLDAERVALPRRFNPVFQQLLAAPGPFLANNRIKTGRGPMTTSGLSPYEMSWDHNNQFYFFEPPNPMHSYMHTTVQGGYNIAVTAFTTIANLGQIAGAVVGGSIGFTTQLSGCSILYSVNGGNLVVAHVWPDSGASVKANLPAALVGAPGTAGAILALRMAHEGDLSNPVGGGTFGIYGMVDDPADTGLRAVGPNNVRTHGYSDTLGNAYFVAVKVGGNWQLYGQQNNPGVATAGVGACLQLYP